MKLRRFFFNFSAGLSVILMLGTMAKPVQGAQADGHGVKLRAELRAAFAAADNGLLEPAQADRFAGAPVHAWLQAVNLRKQISTVAPERMQTVLESMDQQVAGAWLRSTWLNELIRREDWASFRSVYRGGGNAALRCASLLARISRQAEQGSSDAGAPDPEWVADASKIWLNGSSLPTVCDGVLAKLDQLGALGDDMRWQRFDLAIDTGATGVMRAIAGGMSADAAQLALSYAAYLAQPTDALPAWPKAEHERNSNVTSAALVRLGRADPDRAQLLAAQLPAAMLNAEQNGRIAYQVALWTVASYLPASAQRLNAVPASAYDERLHEWRVREAISRGDDASALVAIEKMTTAQQSDTRWQYFKARLLGVSAALEQARPFYQKAARSANFHGWLAADRLQQPYLLCPLEPVTEGLIKQRASDDAGLALALDLFALGRADLAAREWAAATKAMSASERYIAVQMALQEGWFDRSVVGMTVAKEDRHYYSLRFPVHHAADIRAQSKLNGLDPAWVAAQTRAESSFMPDARSGADARGLMQLLPGTGAQTAKRLGIPWEGDESLYEPVTNLRLGTAYMRQMLDRFGGLPYMAIGAYNAGPTPVRRWRDARGQLEPDFFIESIPYKETREYVARVLAFSVIYDWRLNGNAAPLSARMLGLTGGEAAARRPFTCPAPTTTEPALEAADDQGMDE
jgi:soluble lytic murein transglycosylase